MRIIQNRLCLVLTLSTFSSYAFAETRDVASFLPKKLVTGGGHTCVLSSQGQIKCWGYNEVGELGVGTATNHGLEQGTMGRNLPFVNLGRGVLAQNMCAGNDFTCALTSTGAVKCWGANYNGQLGQERELSEVGLLATQMGDNLPVTDLGADFTASDIQCGSDFACALSTAGKVKCWGNGRYGQLGVALTNRTNIGRKKDEMGTKLPYLSLPTPVTQITTGYGHACAVAGGKVFCWGQNNSGQTGLEQAAVNVYLPTDETQPKLTVKLEDSATEVAIESVKAGGDFTCALYQASGNGLPGRRKIKCWGLNSLGQLGLGVATKMIGRLAGTMGAMLPELNLGFSNIAQLETHDRHTCVTSKQGALKCWGRNSSGQLGLGDRITRGTNPDQMGSKLPFIELSLPVLSISNGAIASTTCAILINHEIKCWGDGSSGALGYEDDMNRGNAENQMGDHLPYVQIR